MNKYDKNILDIFKYYNREYKLLDERDESTKTNDNNGSSSVKNHDVDLILDEPIKIAHANEASGTYAEPVDVAKLKQSLSVVSDIQALIDTNYIILGGVVGSYGDQFRTIRVLKDLLLKNSSYCNMATIFDDFKVLQNTVSVLGARNNARHLVPNGVFK
jgi:hypothetical protein